MVTIAIFTTFLQTNTFQGVHVTNGTTSYGVFIYNCDLMGWSGTSLSTLASVGFYSEGNFYQNHLLSNTTHASRVACLNLPDSVWNNVVYRLDYQCKPNSYYYHWKN